MINSSIHTIQLYKRVNYQEQLFLSHILEHLNIPVYETGSSCIYVLEGKGPAGITALSLVRHYDEALSYCTDFHLEIVLNPMRALCDTVQKNAVAISAIDLPSALEEILFSARQDLKLDLLDGASLSRVDFCMDLKFEHQEQADDYISLLKKFPCKRVLREVLHWDSTQRRMVPYSESKLMVCGSYAFQIYPKYTQMLNHGLPGAEYARGVVRIELRASRKKLRSLYYKYASLLKQCENWCQELVILAGLSREIIEGIMLRMLGSGDFYPAKTLLQKIDDSPFYAASKVQMKRAVDYFMLHTSGTDVLKNLGLSSKQWREVMKRFSAIKGCPIPVPTRAYQLWYPGVTSWDFYFDAL